MPAKIERIAGLDDRLDAIPEAGRAEFPQPARKWKIVVKDGPNVIFDGWQIGQVETKPNRDGRFETCELYAVAGGGFVAARG